MDPKVAFAHALTGDNESRKELNGWISRGGFRPRVQAHPATDAWMSGDRFGEVVWVRPDSVRVRMDVSGRIRRFPFDLVTVVE